MGTFVGRVFHDKQPAPVAAPARKGRPKKEELLAQARELGIEVPSRATNPEIMRLIEEARA